MAKRTDSRQPATIAPTAPCPCGLGQPYAECCGRLHSGQLSAPTAELLMRSRFTAFALRDRPYLLRSWHPDTRPPNVLFDPAQQWTRLEVLHRTGGGLLDAEGTVEFRAHYTEHGKPGVMRENSRFVRHEGGWVYLGESLARGGPAASSGA